MMHVALEAKRSLLIDGNWRSADRHMDVLNPFTQDLLGQVACASVGDAGAAVASAVEGFDEISSLSTAARARILAKVADALEQNSDHFASTITAETGKTIRSAIKEVARAVNTLRLSAEEATRLTGETIAFDSFSGGEDRSGYYIFEPVGVIVAITPFNDPLNLICHKLGPAFAAGNSVVLKPAEQAPLVAIMLARLFLSAGLPRKALNLLTGFGRDFGEVLTGHPAVAMVSFTGGAGVGEAICRSAGMKRIGMELGANSPVIVMADANVEKASTSCVSGAFGAAGQNCIGVQRIYVHDAIYDAFRERFVAMTEKLQLGDPMDPATDVGPMIDNVQAERLERWTREAEANGAKLLTGGSCKQACFEPTVLENVPSSASVACEEVFGPVVSLFRFTDLDRAIDEANSADFAIHAAIFTESIRHAHHAARRLQAGGVMINDSTDYRLDAMPFGGAKRGNMGREGVRFAVREMSRTKVVCFNEA